MLDESRYQRVLAEARHRDVSVALVIREAIDRALPATALQRQEAVERILSAPDMPVPAKATELRAELEQLRGRKG